MVKFTVALALAAPALALENEHLVAMPMHQFKQECGMKSDLKIKPGAASLLQNVPGAGIASFKPFDTVLKDGFLEVACVKDYMYYRGDKFGDNKHDYKLGPVSNVSIVHYDAFVAKEDRKEMTQKVCFEFCRTVPNMGFFGIVNGRGCYCTPYFTPMESDSTQCDAVCDGDNTLMCGGKSKSSVFAMHMCDSTKDDLGARKAATADVRLALSGQAKKAKATGKTLQDVSAVAQKIFGAVGDSGATGLAQDGKVFAGVLTHAAEDGEKHATHMDGLEKEAPKLTDFTDPATVTKAERLMEDMDEAVAEGEVQTDKLEKLNELGTPSGKAAGAAKQYYPVMYFVDKEYDSVPSTCSGDRVAKPSVGSLDECAHACDKNIHDCVGFQHITDGKDGLCFQFSRFNTGFYYTGCKGKSAFLQADGAPAKGGKPSAGCYAKLSKFEGTSLKPDGSGKNKQAFKDLTKADRCPM